VKVAALYDVHGMIRALEAVLADVEREDVGEIVFGGDLLYGPFPRETVELARATGGQFVRGNCEREPDEWDREQLSDDDLRWLAELPTAVSVDGVLYCHAAPADDMPITTAATPDEAVAATFAGVEERVVVIGHTHHQFDRQVGDLRVVNAGSVGMPYEDDIAAFWAVIEDWAPSFRRTVFDVERSAAEIRASGWPARDGFVAENLLVPAPRDEAIAELEQRRET
jgi:predicted phosphodiesterase